MSNIEQAPAQLPLPPPRDLPAGDSELLDRVRERVAELIALEGAGPDADPHDGQPPALRLRVLRQISLALADAVPRDVPYADAGLGSMLTLQDSVTGEYLEYLLMAGDLVDLDAGQVSMASAIGQSVLGRRAGDSVTVLLPRGRRSFRIAALTTLPAALGLRRPARRRPRAKVAAVDAAQRAS